MYDVICNMYTGTHSEVFDSLSAKLRACTWPSAETLATPAGFSWVKANAFGNPCSLQISASARMSPYVLDLLAASTRDLQQVGMPPQRALAFDSPEGYVVASPRKQHWSRNRH